MVSAFGIAALAALHAASKRFNPSHESEGFSFQWFHWPTIKVVLRVVGCALLVAGLAALVVRPDKASAFFGLGAALIAARYALGILFVVSGEEDEI